MSNTRWHEIAAEMGALQDKWRREGSMAWYRGHERAEWELTSTLQRLVQRFFDALAKPPSDEQKRELLRGECKTQYRHFKQDVWPLLDAAERSDWGVVFAMQHYGQATRLLDWTASLACAAYFALFRSCEHCHEEGEDAAIWMLDPQALNRLSVKVEGLIALDEDMREAVVNVREWHPKWWKSKKVLSSIAVEPDFTNPRMKAQRAAFTISGDSFEPLDKEFKKLVDEGRLRKFVLSPEVCKEAAVFLDEASLDSYSFFPDLHGLALRHKDETRQRFVDLERWYPDSLKR